MVTPPEPPSEVTRRRMQRQPARDTQVELALRRCLHAAGLRYFVHRRPIPTLRRVADLVFPRSKVAVFVDGCFWHGCPDHGSWPKRNADWWRNKIETNRARDRETDATLEQAGWTVVRVWEHEAVSVASERVAATVRSR
jgi:DNA mismatch endonuclease (patch repair protein)